MADYRKVAQHFPAVRDYLRSRKWTRRGDVTAYAPGIETPSFSTDRFGFRHTVFARERLGVADIDRLTRYSLVLGASHVFGFGLAGNHQTFASQLSEGLGHPCLGVSFPEGVTRVLHATLLRILSGASRKPERIFVLAGGDLTRFCYSGRCDPLFGSPDFIGMPPPTSTEEVRAAVPHLQYFTAFWLEQCRQAAAAAGSRFVLGDEPTFFEKSAPDAIEAACALGIGSGPHDRLANYRLVSEDCRRTRRQIRDRLGLRPWPNHDNAYGYIDEFHYRADTIGVLTALLLREA